MRLKDRLPRQSVMLLLVCALIVPAIVAVAVGFGQTQSERRRVVERDAITQARQITDRTDLVILSDLRSLRLIGSTRVFALRDWDAVGQLAQTVSRELSQWKAFTIRDGRTGELLYSSAQEVPGQPLRPLPANIPADGLAEGVFREGAHCPCVVMHLPAPTDPDVILTAFIDPAVFQAIMKDGIAPGTTAAIVDRLGHFLARAPDFERRLGTPATIYVRRAARRGGEGFYRGRTYEGLENYTAYSASPETGWSSHVAVDRSLIEGPRARARAALTAALAAGLALATILLLFAAYDSRSLRRHRRRMAALQKSEAIGQFTSIVVHDFRNLLAVTLSGLAQISRRTTDPEIERIADAVRDAIQRGNKLVNQLLDFVRGDVIEVREVDLEATLAGMDQLLRSSLGDGIRLDWTIEPEARLVQANPDQLELAMLNLARNASEAMDGRGEFLIFAERDNGLVRIDVCDSGPGVPPELRSRVLAPFYTTKGSEVGTGLGLAQVAGAVQQAGGRIEIDDRPEGGARFKLFLKPAG
jgi:signal transduction histidine kinase